MDTKVCPTCKKSFSKNYYYSRAYWEKQKYCSLKCSKTLFKKGVVPYNRGFPGKIGKDSNNWRGGRSIMKTGYIRVLIQGTGSYQLEHRMVMEKMIGRKLKTNEVVHHKNHNRQDNRPENLDLMIKTQHDSMETKTRWLNGPQSFGRAR